ncbi:prephenate dehydratase [Alkalibacter mobilis]|uniref:prephenate dehydratase n=1 Tax=Alkalibacter mobilis TaxID=2787712 RepID=UPI00189F1B90|nr:prephenate dehydratase [Alkalibacter mobilis]MBF7096569.1 prephenate dehydratase [Alkalibacter mobilis]
MTKYKAAYQGVPGSYSYQAMREYFGNDVTCMNKMLFSDVFDAVVSGEAEYGILPFENSTTGGVYEVFDLISSKDIYIVGERCIEVKHNLMGVKGTSLDKIKIVYSHQQALDQCSKFIRARNIDPIPTTNTAVSAKLIKEKSDHTTGSIGSKLAADLYDLEILATDINNYFNNITKFIIISKNFSYDDDADKISLYFTTPHKPGALYSALGLFAKNNINLLKLISRPAKNTPWVYSYFVDIQGSIKDPIVKEVLKELESVSPTYKFLGCYKSHNLDV